MMASNGPRPILKELLRWGVAVVVAWFLVQRLRHDWPTVQASLGALQWTWVILAALPGTAYFFARAAAWDRLLAALSVRGRFGMVARIWMNGEIVRYIPGNVWSVLGRMAQAAHLGVSRTVVFASVALETLTLVASAFGISALMLLGYPSYTFPGRTVVMVIVVALSLLAVVPRVVRSAVQLIFRLVRRRDDLPMISPGGGGFAWMVVSWVAYAAFHLGIAVALGVTVSHSLITYAGIFVAAWLIGFLSFVTPSGIGVREAAQAFLFTPFIGAASAILVAVVARLTMLILELVVLGALNLLVRNPAPAPETV